MTKKTTTPYFTFDSSVLKDRYLRLKNVFEECIIAYAMKANPHPAVISQLSALGSNFELASIEELKVALSCGVSPKKIAFGSATKIPSHIKFFANKNVNNFALDSLNEVEKIAKFAPGSNVYVRILVDSRANSAYTLSKKFGANKGDFIKIAKTAIKMGLNVTGVSFNVGSQALNSDAWANGICDLHPLLTEAKSNNINIEYVNIGGGFPIQYDKSQTCPSIEEIAKKTKEQIDSLPYEVDLIIEPGRFLVAESFTAYTSIYALKLRDNKPWAYADMGVYNGFFEALACQGSIKYTISSEKDKHDEKKTPFVIAGPTCDDLDVISTNTLLPQSTQEGDILQVHNVGSYSIPLITKFNGFKAPRVILKKTQKI